MKRILCTILLLLWATTPLEAKKTEELLKMKTEELFELSLEELLDTEITSAGKMAEKVSEIPASVYIVTRQDIEKYGYRTVAEVIRNIPGFYTIYDYQEDLIGVRGILSQNNMIILVNGVVQHTSRIDDIMMPTEAIDRIEVVRGPMSVIYGSGAFLGSINIVTNHIPYGEPLNMVSGSYGSFDTYKAFSRASAEKGDFRFTLNASVYGTDGIEEDYRDLMSPEQYERLHPDAHKQTDGDLERENINVNFSSEYKGFYADFQFNLTDNGMFQREPAFNDGSNVKTGITTAQLGYRHDLTDTFQMDGKITYSFKDMDLTNDTYPPNMYGDDAASEIKGEEERFEGELDLIWKPLPEFNMIFGLYYKTFFDTSYEVIFPTRIESAPDEPRKERYDVSDRDTRSLFMQLNYKPFDRLKLIAGARLEQYMAFETSLNTAGERDIIRRNEHNKDEEIHFIPRIAAVYSLTDHHIFKLMYGEANKPFLSEEVDISTIEEGFQADLEPEEIETIELNYLMSYPNFSLSFSLFRNDIGNLRSFSFEDDGEGNLIPIMDNSGRMVTYGSELILSARPVKHLDLELSVTYQETDDPKDEEKEIAFSPHLLMKGKCAYRWGGFTLGMTGLYVDEMASDRSPPNSADSPPPGEDSSPPGEDSPPPGEVGIGDFKSSDDYFVVDLNLRYDHEKTGLFAAFKIYNIFDEEVRYPATGDVGFENGLIDEGRSFLATVGWKF